MMTGCDDAHCRPIRWCIKCQHPCLTDKEIQRRKGDFFMITQLVRNSMLGLGARCVVTQRVLIPFSPPLL